METVQVLEINVDDIGNSGVYTLVKNVISHSPDNISIDIACLEEFENEENIKSIEKFGGHVFYSGYKGNKCLKQLCIYRKIKSLVRNKQYDAVHIHSDVANKLLVSGLAAKNAGCKNVIFHSHAAGVDGNHRVLKKIFHRFSRIFLPFLGTKFVACSDLAAAWMYPYIKNDRIVIINNGIDLDKFRFNEKIRQEERKKLGISNELLIGHVGRFAYQKNHEYIVKIAEEAKKQELNVKFLFVGTGPKFDEIRYKVEEKQLQDMIIFYGISSSVQNLFQAMDVFILPSHFEGLPIVGVEAQASGLPALFSDQITKETKLIENVEFIGIEETDITKWINSIKKLSTFVRKDTYNELRAKRFGIQDTVNQFLQLYREI